MRLGSPCSLVTALFLHESWLHLLGNLTLLIGPAAFNGYAHFLEHLLHGWLIYAFEIGLLAIGTVLFAASWIDAAAQRHQAQDVAVVLRQVAPARAPAAGQQHADDQGQRKAGDGLAAEEVEREQHDDRFQDGHGPSPVARRPEAALPAHVLPERLAGTQLVTGIEDAAGQDGQATRPGECRRRDTTTDRPRSTRHRPSPARFR